MVLAVQTMEAIEAAIKADQGATFRRHLRACIAACEDAYREDEKPFRAHLGASLLGRKCGREVWLGFRWAWRKMFEGRMIRLFNRGHLEEARFVAMLLTIGVTVWQHDQNGKQFRIVGHKGHHGGSTDGVARGFPEMPEVAVLTEFKTHNDKSFTKLAGSFPKGGSLWKGDKRQGGEGVMKAKWEHFVQMQRYMGYWGLPYAYYFAVNKDTDELHVEIVAYDQAQDHRYAERAATLIDARLPPARVSNSPGWHECKLCDYWGLCHGTAEPERHCRTCDAAIPIEGGKWFCERNQVELSEQDQYNGCDRYNVIDAIKGK